MKMRILICEFMDEAAVKSLARDFDVEYLPESVDDRPTMLARLADVSALIVRNRTQVDAELLAAAPRLKVVGRLGVGLDNIQLALCQTKGIEVIPATGANALAVAEYVVCVAISLLRGAYLSTAQVALGQWPRHQLSSGREARGKTFGVLGFGSIGQATARLARTFGMQPIACDVLFAANDPVWKREGVRCASMDEVFADANVVSLHLPLMAETRNLVSAQRLQSMRKGAVLINTARGRIVDETALVATLKSGHLAGAALDVFAEEPLPAGSPLADCPNLILTPHIAGVSHEANIRVSDLIAQRVAASLHALQKAAT